MSSFNDFTGKTFGRLTALSRGPDARNTYGRPIVQWHCLCICGNTALVRSSKLNSGHTASCGCLQRERSAETATKHGLRNSRAYNTWSNMKDRCHNPNSARYHLWGGRGIAVCDEWRDDFSAFYAYMGEPPKGTTIDRIDNDKGYEPGNVRWATPIQQANNTRTTNRYELDGETRTLTEWAQAFGCSRDAVKLRLRRGQSLAHVAEVFGYRPKASDIG